MQTVRFYFEHGAKVEGAIWWQCMWNNRFANRLIKDAKMAGIKHVILFHVCAGYLDGQAIQWAGEICSMKHPECIEITDTKEKLSKFLREQESRLSGVKTIIVERQEIIFYQNDKR